MREGVMPKVSVIAAVYNTSKYLGDCIDSILSQSYRDIELILVDDGSTDNSPEICREYEAKDGRVRVIRKENRGLGMARNTGIEAARGEYLLFVDSDDTVEDDLVLKALRHAEAADADVCVFGFNTVDTAGNVLSSFVPGTKKDKLEGDEILCEFIPDMLGPDIRSKDKSIIIAPSAWSFFYKKELVDRAGFRFVSEREIISEDVYSHLVLAADIRKVSVIYEPLYNYRVNPSSLTHTYRADRHTKNAHFYRECEKLCELRSYPKEIKERITEPYIANMIAAIKSACANTKSYSEAKNRLSEICAEPTFCEVVKTKLKEKNNNNRHILFWCLDRKMYLAVYLLVRAKLSKGRP